MGATLREACELKHEKVVGEHLNRIYPKQKPGTRERRRKVPLIGSCSGADYPQYGSSFEKEKCKNDCAK